jgi:hypothetical protein
MPGKARSAEVTGMFVGAAVGVAVMISLTLGFLTGGLLYRQSRRWCPQCGASTVELAEQRRASAK